MHYARQADTSWSRGRRCLWLCQSAFGPDPQEAFNWDIRQPLLARLTNTCEDDKSWSIRWDMQNYGVLINLNATRTAVDRPSLKSRNLVKHSHAQASVFYKPEGITIPLRTDEEPVVTTTLPWYSRTFASLTIYGELSAARTPKEFALLRRRLQQEWSFIGGLVSRFSIRFINSRLIRHLVQSS